MQELIPIHIILLRILKLKLLSTIQSGCGCLVNTSVKYPSGAGMPVRCVECEANYHRKYITNHFSSHSK